MSGAEGKSAAEVSEALLDQTGQALLARDFETFASCFHLPHFISTADYKTTIVTRNDLRAVFDKVTEEYLSKQVTNLVRICDVAEYCGETRIRATHTTHMMSGDRRVADPFPSYSELERIDGHWKVASSQYAVDTNTTADNTLTSALKLLSKPETKGSSSV